MFESSKVFRTFSEPDTLVRGSHLVQAITSLNRCDPRSKDLVNLMGILVRVFFETFSNVPFETMLVTDLIIALILSKRLSNTLTNPPGFIWLSTSFSRFEPRGTWCSPGGPGEPRGTWCSPLFEKIAA